MFTRAPPAALSKQAATPSGAEVWRKRRDMLEAAVSENDCVIASKVIRQAFAEADECHIEKGIFPTSAGALSQASARLPCYRALCEAPLNALDAGREQKRKLVACSLDVMGGHHPLAKKAQYDTVVTTCNTKLDKRAMNNMMTMCSDHSAHCGSGNELGTGLKMAVAVFGGSLVVVSYNVLAEEEVAGGLRRTRWAVYGVLSMAESSASDSRRLLCKVGFEATVVQTFKPGEVTDRECEVHIETPDASEYEDAMRLYVKSGGPHVARQQQGKKEIELLFEGQTNLRAGLGRAVLRVRRWTEEKVAVLSRRVRLRIFSRMAASDRLLASKRMQLLKDEFSSVTESVIAGIDKSRFRRATSHRVPSGPHSDKVAAPHLLSTVDDPKNVSVSTRLASYICFEREREQGRDFVADVDGHDVELSNPYIAGARIYKSVGDERVSHGAAGEAAKSSGRRIEHQGVCIAECAAGLSLATHDSGFSIGNKRLTEREEDELYGVPRHSLQADGSYCLDWPGYEVAPSRAAPGGLLAMRNGSSIMYNALCTVPPMYDSRFICTLPNHSKGSGTRCMDAEDSRGTFGALNFAGKNGIADSLHRELHLRRDGDETATTDKVEAQWNALVGETELCPISKEMLQVLTATSSFLEGGAISFRDKVPPGLAPKHAMQAVLGKSCCCVLEVYPCAFSSNPEKSLFQARATFDPAGKLSFDGETTRALLGQLAAVRINWCLGNLPLGFSSRLELLKDKRVLAKLGSRDALPFAFRKPSAGGQLVLQPVPIDPAERLTADVQADLAERQAGVTTVLQFYNLIKYAEKQMAKQMLFGRKVDLRWGGWHAVVTGRWHTEGAGRPADFVARHPAIDELRLFQGVRTWELLVNMHAWIVDCNKDWARFPLGVASGGTEARVKFYQMIVAEEPRRLIREAMPGVVLPAVCKRDETRAIKKAADAAAAADKQAAAAATAAAAAAEEKAEAAERKAAAAQAAAKAAEQAANKGGSSPCRIEAAESKAKEREAGELERANKALSHSFATEYAKVAPSRQPPLPLMQFAVPPTYAWEIDRAAKVLVSAAVNKSHSTAWLLGCMQLTRMQPTQPSLLPPDLLGPVAPAPAPAATDEVAPQIPNGAAVRISGLVNETAYNGRTGRVVGKSSLDDGKGQFRCWVRMSCGTELNIKPANLVEIPPAKSFAPGNSAGAAAALASIHRAQASGSAPKAAAQQRAVGAWQKRVVAAASDGQNSSASPCSTPSSRKRKHSDSLEEGEIADEDVDDIDCPNL